MRDILAGPITEMVIQYTHRIENCTLIEKLFTVVIDTEILRSSGKKRAKNLACLW